MGLEMNNKLKDYFYNFYARQILAMAIRGALLSDVYL